MWSRGGGAVGGVGGPALAGSDHVRLHATRQGDVLVLGAHACEAEPPAQAAWEPVGGQSASLDVNHDAPAREPPSVCLGVRAAQVCGALKLDESVAARDTLGVARDDGLDNGAEELELGHEVRRGERASEPAHKQRRGGVRCHLARVHLMWFPCGWRMGEIDRMRREESREGEEAARTKEKSTADRSHIAKRTVKLTHTAHEPQRAVQPPAHRARRASPRPPGTWSCCPSALQHRRSWRGTAPRPCTGRASARRWERQREPEAEV